MKTLIFILIIAVVSITKVFAQATCALAINLTPGTTQCGKNDNAGSFPDNGSVPKNPCNNVYNDGEYWFKYVGEGYKLQLSVSDLNATYSGIFVLDGCPGGTTNCISSHVSGSSTDNYSITTPVLTNGTTYYIVIANYSTPYSTDFCLYSSVLYTYLMNSGTITTCGGIFYDPQGEANYADFGSSITETFCSATGESIKFVFTQFATNETADNLKIYDGPNATFPLIGTYSQTNSPGIVTSSESCLTFVWTTDLNHATTPGWKADISCTPPPPINDNCIKARLLPANPYNTCYNKLSGTVENATQSSQPVAPCIGSPDDDVWYSFEAISSIHTISLSNIQGDQTDMYFAVYKGDCNNLTNILCSDFNTNNVSGLITGETYYVRVYTKANTVANTTFDICTYPLFHIHNDNCIDATNIVVNAGSNCTYNTAGSLINATASLPSIAPCGGSADDDVWFSFVATQTTHYIKLQNIIPTNTDMGFAVYKGSCNALTNILCSDVNEKAITGLIVGNTYYIRVYSYGSAPTNATFNICITSKKNSLCDGASSFCTGVEYDFPAGTSSTGGGSGEAGPDYGCLSSTPNPVWYRLDISENGLIEIHMIAENDIDFACWGPFNSMQNPCTQGLLTAGTNHPTHHAPGPSPSYPSLNMIDCSYDGSREEWCYIPNAQAGEFYLFLITNYSNTEQNISFSQISGTGISDCAGVIMPGLQNNGPLCIGDTLSLFISNPIPNVSYVWSGPNNFVSYDINLSIPDVTSANAGVYSVEATLGSSHGTSTTTVVVQPKPNVSISASSLSICKGESVSLSALGADSYIWSNNNNNYTISISPIETTEYVVTGTNLGGCADTANITINVKPNPSISAIASPASVCVGDSSIISATGANTYSWNHINTHATDSFIASPTTTTTYTVIGTAANGCKDTASVNLTVDPLPVLNIVANPASVCIGSSTTLSVTGAATYSWSHNVIGSPITVIPTASPTYIVTGTSAAGCVSEKDITIPINPLPIITAVANPTTICEGATSVLTGATQTGGNLTSYIWSNGVNGNNISVTPTATTQYTITGTDANGCKDTADVSVIVNPLPIITAVATPPSICTGNNSEISASGATEYVWNNNKTENTFTDSPNATTTYSVTGTDINGCKKSAIATLIVNPNPIIVLNANPQTICVGDNTTISASGAVNYTWIPAGSGSSFMDNPTNSTIYNVEGTSEFGCKSSAEIEVIVEPTSVFEFTPDIVNGCEPLVVNFTTNSIGNVKTWKWSFGDGGTSLNKDPIHTYNAGVWSVALEAITAAGCKSKVEKGNLVSVHKNPYANFITNQNYYTEIDKIVFFDDISKDANTYFWNFGDGIGTSNEQNPVYLYDKVGEYNVLLVVSDGMCIDSITKKIVINPISTLYFPTAFSPNGDGLNDEYKPYGTLKDIKKFNMQIFNRWGNLVFETSDINDGWNGLEKPGVEAPQGIYTVIVRIIDFDGIERQIIKSLTIIR